jgi:site-specific DNA-methyltransferase (adenine-specific)
MKTAMQELIVINGNNIEILKDYPDNYFDSVVTDPPYGLGKEPNAAELMKDWVEHGYHEVSGSGFMGKEWDAFVPQPVFWKEVFRVLKNGGHVLSFFGTRTYDWGVMSMRFAGFEVRDCIQWLYGSGFPKSHNISKALDKMEGAERELGKLKFKGGTQLGVINDDNWKPKDVYETYASTDSAKQWDGWGTALKPANEPIVLARKPLEKGLSIAENILKWGVGGINIDASRIATTEKLETGFSGKILNSNNGWNENSMENKFEQNSQGRFPANIILTHHPECECKGTKKVKSVSAYKSKDGYDNESIVFNGNLNSMKSDGYADENGNETVEDWDCHEDCPIRILDEQSGTLNKQGISKTDNKSGWQNSYVGGDGVNAVERKLYLDTGGASRFFKTFSQDDIHYCYLCGKANKNELWKNNYNNVLNAVSNLKSTSQMKEPIVQENVTESLRKKADQIVKNVANLCDLCVTNFVQEVVKINNLDTKKEQLPLMRDFIQDYRKCTLLQSLVCYVEMMDNIDTTPTTQNLLKLFGYVWTAIENYIKKDIKEAEAQKLGLTRFQYQAKASKAERNKGLDDFEEKRPDTRDSKGMGTFEQKRVGIQKNFHPTVKPIKLMQYLIKMITPPNGIVLDPFCGSGTTGVACKLEGFQFVGMEQDPEYSKIAEGRINNYVEENGRAKKIKPKENEEPITTQTTLF